MTIETGSMEGASWEGTPTKPSRCEPNVVLTPHLGYATEDFFRIAYEDTIENIAAFASGKPIRVLTAERNDSRLVRI